VPLDPDDISRLYRLHARAMRRRGNRLDLGIAHHQLSALHRRGGVERRAMDRLGVERRALTDPEYERIEEPAGLAQTRGRVAAALGELPAEHADVLRLRVVDELGLGLRAVVLHPPPS
jgi:DNA-directed RNA polymerase specialized sigma24 family protein